MSLEFAPFFSKRRRFDRQRYRRRGDNMGRLVLFVIIGIIAAVLAVIKFLLGQVTGSQNLKTPHGEVKRKKLWIKPPRGSAGWNSSGRI